MSIQDVSNVLWRERQLLELLLFKLETEQLLLASGRTRWLHLATREIERVVEELRAAELERSVVTQGVVAELGLPGGASLRQLAERAPAPWGKLLEEHRRAFLTLTQELQVLSNGNKELLTRGADAARRVLDGVGEVDPDLYSAAGVAASPSSGPRLLDQAL